MLDFLFRRKNYPEFWQNYLHFFNRTWSKRTPIEQVRFVVLDTETTRLEPAQDKYSGVGFGR